MSYTGDSGRIAFLHKLVFKQKPTSGHQSFQSSEVEGSVPIKLKDIYFSEYIMSKSKWKSRSLKNIYKGKESPRMDMENTISLNKLQSLKEYLSRLKTVDGILSVAFTVPYSLSFYW